MAFGLTRFIIPSIVTISRLKNLCIRPNERTSHNGTIPNLGGIAVFIGLILSTVIFAGSHFLFELKYIITGFIIVFFIGIKDDILVINPLKKLGGQIFASFVIAIFADIRISSLFGLFNNVQLPYIISIFLTVFVLVVILNGFNIIDGIDGLASGIGILISATFGIWFWMTGNIAYAVFSFSFIGALSAFFWFNVFGKTNKIFLGDTGSMIIGFAVGIMTCRFLQHEWIPGEAFNIGSAPSVVAGILIVPLFDLLRVFVLRISQGRSPFKADRQHIHHRLLELGYSHLKSTIILISVNIFFIILAWSLRNIGFILLLGVITGLAGLMSFFLVSVAGKKEKETATILIWKFARKSLKHRIKINGNTVKQPERVLEREKCSTITRA